jgi:hypothetical protein
MKKILILASVILCSYGLIAIVADTTFSWSGGGQTGTLTYTGLGLASPVISGTITDTATHTLAANKLYVGNTANARTAMAVTGDVTITQDGTNVTTAIAGGVIVNADVNASAAIASTKLAGVAGVPDASASAVALTNTVTITAKDTAGSTLAARRLVRVWVAETAYGAPSTNNITSVTLSGGTAIETVTAGADYIYLTAATGIASADVIGIAAGTNYVMVADGGAVTSEAVVFTE